MVFATAAPAIFGFYDGNGDISINQELDADKAAVTIAHELGHAFGLVHVPASVRPSVMNPGNLSVTPTAGDRDALAAIWGTCPPAM